MEASADRRQIGHLDVDSEALREGGAELGVVLATLGLDPDDLPAETPTHGWRVLRDRAENGVVLGAPVDDRADSWRIAQVSPVRNGTSARHVTLHPDTFPLRPSRAQRSRGLVLRWPEVIRSEPDVDRLAVDVVNAGEDRWRPNGDSFHVVGTLRRPGDDAKSYLFAFVAGQDPAFPLDAGEYARVRVVIDSNQWREIEPGRYNIHAVLAELGVRAETPLELELTEELIDRHRPRTGRPSAPSSDQRPAMTERLEIIRALLSARDRLGAVMEIVAVASSDDDARQGIQELLDCTPSASGAVYSASLRRFRSGHPDLLAREAEELKRALE